MQLLCALLAATSALLAQVIEGTVTDSRTGAPLAGVTVTIEAAGRTAYQATTDTQGAFRIEGVTAGSYAANFRKPEFLPPRRDAEVSRQFRVGPGSDSIRLKAELTPLSRISGRVFDGRDQPVSAAQVFLNGAVTKQNQASDQQGGFAFQAPPGVYSLVAQPPRALKPPPATGEQRLAWARTYYPEAADRRGAVKLVVRVGSDLWGQDIRLRAAPVRRVRGVALDPRGDPAPHAPLEAVSIEDETLSDTLEAVAAEDGGFEFPAMHDGEWLLSAQIESGGVRLRAFATAQVSGRDLDRVELHLAAPFSIHGSVSFLGDAGRKPQKIPILLRPKLAVSGGLRVGATDPDGNFTIHNVYSGMYKILAIPPGPPYFLSSVRIGDSETLGQYVELAPGAVPANLVFDSKGGSLRGTVEDCGSATVALAPQDSGLQEPQFIQTAVCREGGRFEMTNIRPGDYYVQAFDHWDGPLKLLSGLDQSLATRAVAVRIGGGEVAAVDLRVTARAP